MKTVWTGPRHRLKYFWYVSGPALALACFALILLQVFAISSSAKGSPLITPTASNTFTPTNTATITPGGPTLPRLPIRRCPRRACSSTTRLPSLTRRKPGY